MEVERDAVPDCVAGLTAAEPAWRALPADRTFGSEFLALRDAAFGWLAPYYDRVHLTRAADWMLVVAPDAPEHLVLAALMHDLERSIPGGPALAMATMPWDDKTYNDAHTGRSAAVVATWLVERGAPEELVVAVQQPIREHEFGGSPEGDLMQAADSISFLEANGALVSGWAQSGRCSAAKAEEKLRWMYERIRLERARPLALPYFERSVAQLHQAR
ncbi:MAG TPA: hypothetical protein VI318_24215 [Baekduia sp.]